MNLEERYNSGDGKYPYVARVKSTQEASVGVRTGVDFMDAGARSATAVDQFQSNFQRRAERDTTVVQGGNETVTYGASQLKGISRWFGRALNYAFTDPKASGNHIQDSQWTSFKNPRNNRDTWTDNNNVFHRWTPEVKFNASDKLSQFAKNNATGKKPV